MPPIKFPGIYMPKLDADGEPVVDGSGDVKPEPGDRKFKRNIRTSRIGTSVNDYNYDVLKMEVTVRWRGGHAGDGYRRVKIDSNVMVPGI